MPVTAINHFNLCAERAMLDTLRDFYANIFGLKPGYRPPFNHFGYWLYLDAQPLLHLSEAAPGDPRQANSAPTTFDHVAFTCTERSRMETRLTRYHVPFQAAVIPETGVQQLFFNDPSGNKVELCFLANEA